jgi:hypothetical protein
MNLKKFSKIDAQISSDTHEQDGLCGCHVFAGHPRRTNAGFELSGSVLVDWLDVVRSLAMFTHMLHS